MQITFNLYNANGLVSENTLSPEEFTQFRDLAESLKQTVKLVKVTGAN